MKKTISILMAILMMAVLFAGCKNISDSDNGKIEPSTSAAPILPSTKPSDDDAGTPTIMPELVPSDNQGESDKPSTAPSTSPDASKTPATGSEPPAGGNSSPAGNDTAGEGGSANT